MFSKDISFKGIGSMNDERWKSFYMMMAEQGIFENNLDYSEAYTLKFIENDKWYQYYYL